MNEINVMCATTARLILNEARTYNKTDRLEVLADLLDPRMYGTQWDSKDSEFKDHFTYTLLPLLLEGFVGAQDSSSYCNNNFTQLWGPLAYVSSCHLRDRLTELLAELCVDVPSFEDRYNTNDDAL